MAEHAVLSGKALLSVDPAHGPGAAARNARLRYAEVAESKAHLPVPELPVTVPGIDEGRDVQVRDLAVYEQLFALELEQAA